MSRSSKGFADFFPTAPSVLQQKRSKAAQNRRRPKSPSFGQSHISNVPKSTPASADGETEGDIVSNGARNVEARIDPICIVQEENESVQGDLLNGVGSASSTSTSSSIFSTSHRALGMAHPNEPHTSTSLTPLTNVDSSPPSNPLNSPRRKRIHEMAASVGSTTRSPMQEQTRSASEVQTPNLRPHQSRAQARPGRGEIKGLKIVYDPDLDKSLNPKEKKSRKVQYQHFGKEVGLSCNTPATAFSDSFWRNC